MSLTMTKSCAHCQKPGSKLLCCSACKSVSYCGPDCQRAAWKSHKTLCRLTGTTLTPDASPEQVRRVHEYDRKMKKAILNSETVDKGVQLVAAASTGRLAAVRELMAGGSARHRAGLAMISATQSGFSDIVKYFVEEEGIEPDAVAEEPHLGNASSFSMACLAGNLPLAQYLHEKGADPRHALQAVMGNGLTGTTSLHMAAQQGHIDVVRFLISVGADIVAKITDPRSPGATPIYFAARKGHADCIAALADAGAPCEVQCCAELTTPLVMAALNGHNAAVTELLNRGVGPDSGRPDGFTPLMAAAQNGHLDTIKILLARGADVRKTCNNATATVVALKSGKSEVVALLSRLEGVEVLLMPDGRIASRSVRR